MKKLHCCLQTKITEDKLLPALTSSVVTHFGSKTAGGDNFSGTSCPPLWICCFQVLLTSNKYKKKQKNKKTGSSHVPIKSPEKRSVQWQINIPQHKCYVYFLLAFLLNRLNCIYIAPLKI